MQSILKDELHNEKVLRVKKSMNEEDGKLLNTEKSFDAYQATENEKMEHLRTIQYFQFG